MIRYLLLVALVGLAFWLYYEGRKIWRTKTLRKLDEVVCLDGVPGVVTVIERYEDMTLFGVKREDEMFAYYKREQLTKKLETK